MEFMPGGNIFCRFKIPEEMAAGIAHEIRNQLSSIKGAYRILNSEIKSFVVPEHQEYLDIVTEEIDRIDSGYGE